MNKFDKIVSISIFVVLVAFCVTLVCSYYYYCLTGEDLVFRQTKEESSQKKSIDWAELYPFEETVEESNLSTYQLIKSFYFNETAKFNSVGNRFKGHLANVKELEEIGRSITFFLDHKSACVQLKNGNWIPISPKEGIQYSYLKDLVNSLRSFFTFLSDQAIPVMYIQTPITVSKYNPLLPSSVYNNDNQFLDLFDDEVLRLGMDMVDLRAEMYKTGMDHYSHFYKTDHHWTVETGFWASNVIKRQLNDLYGYSMEYCDTNSFYLEKYQKAMFGSYGQMVTHNKAESEDFDILIPKFDSRFEIQIPDINICRNGGFKDSFIDYELLNQCIEKGGGFIYESMSYGNRPLKKIFNLDNERGLKVLMISDSFSLAVVPYLALACSEIDVIDNREENGNFNGSIRSYILNNHPDIVLLLLSFPIKSFS